jgi:hypothetical protein
LLERAIKDPLVGRRRNPLGRFRNYQKAMKMMVPLAYLNRYQLKRGKGNAVTRRRRIMMYLDLAKLGERV